MSGRRAKAMRREVYGDLSLRTPRKYFMVENRAYIGQIVNDPKGLRALYQRAKKAHRHG